MPYSLSTASFYNAIVKDKASQRQSNEDFCDRFENHHLKIERLYRPKKKRRRGKVMPHIYYLSVE